MPRNDTNQAVCRRLESRLAAMEQLIEVYEKSVLEQAEKLYGEIADRNLTEKRLLRLNRTLRLLSDCGDALVRSADEPALLDRICREIVEVGGYRLAWVGYVGEGGEMVPAAMAVHAGGCLAEVDEAAEGGMGKSCNIARAIAVKGGPAGNAPVDGPYASWLSEGVRRGCTSAVAFPLKGAAGVFGVLNLHAAEVWVFDVEELRLLEELANNLAYGIMSLRVAAERKRYEEQLEYQATHDCLTALPNRNLLEDRIYQALAYARRHRRWVAVLLIDLDFFKFINDSLGHGKGDHLLKMVAERLTERVRQVDTLAHQGGDKFVVVLTDLKQSEDATQVAHDIREAVSHPFRMDGQEIVISCSIGISVYPRDGKEVQTLVKNAEVAMYRAKEQGRNSFHYYTRELNERLASRMMVEKHLRKALENNEFELWYQPQADLNTGRINGMEGLIRWCNPELGMIPPGSFIPLAEETGLIVPIGAWVLQTACAQNKAWQDAGLPLLTVAVNLSARQFRERELTGLIAGMLRATGLEPRYLGLEIVESMVMQDVESATAMLNDLKALGVQLSMDDFGTGYSSLSYLKRFPFAKLKIDLSFVRDITTDPGSAAIAKSIIAMAHNLSLCVIAEGVETEGQLEFLRAHGCDEIQGYYFSRPLPPRDFEDLLRENRRLPLREPGELCPAKTLLLIDDDPLIVEAFQQILRLEGYRVLTAENAARGLELLAVTRVGVIICDQRLPGMSGTEFLSRVKKFYPDTVRIALSGYADLDLVTEAINRGAIYKFLTKPIKEEQLLRTVREAFRHFKAGD